MTFKIESRDESGLHFQANNRGWSTIAEFVIETFPEIYQETIEEHYNLKSLFEPDNPKNANKEAELWQTDRPWHVCDGHGLDKENAKLLGQAILKHLKKCKKNNNFALESKDDPRYVVDPGKPGDMDKFLKKFAQFCLKSEGFWIN